MGGIGVVTSLSMVDGAGVVLLMAVGVRWMEIDLKAAEVPAMGLSWQ